MRRYLSVLKTFLNGKSSWLLWLGLFFFLLGLLIPTFTGRVIKGSIYDSNDQLRKSDHRFYWSNGTVTDKYVFTVPLYLTTNRVFQIYPNDCIKSIFINHKEFTGLKGDLCDGWSGITVYAKNYLKLGDNTIQVEVEERQYKRSFYIKPSVEDPVRMGSFMSIGIGWFCILVFWFSRYFKRENKKHSWIVLGLFGMMYALSLRYIIGSELFKRAADITGHLDYIKLLLRGEWLPLSDSCWQCYHPNTYYWFSKFIYQIGNTLRRMEPFELIRVVTWMTWWIGIGFATRFLYVIFYQKQTKTLKNLLIFFVAIALFYFYPIQFYFGAKITNDIFHYICTYIALFYGLQSRNAYQDNDDNKLGKNSFMAFLWTIIGLFMKSNSIIRFPVVLFPFILRLWRGGIWKNLIGFKNLIIKIFIIGIVGFGLLFTLNYFKGVHEIVDNADRLQTGTELDGIPLTEAFLSFYPSEFIQEKFLRVSDTNRSYKSFWNIFLKSMILGENIENENKHPYFYLLTIPGLVLLIYMFVNILNIKKKNLYLGVGIILPFIAMMVYRIVYPLAPSMHFRYIYPALLFVVYFMIQGFSDLKTMEEIKLKHIVLVLAIILFISYGIYFSLPPYF